jgi:hypothetical protein
MPFVHSLVRSTHADKPGWCAPVELGEAAPHYISFVLPVDENGAFFASYSCEAVTIRKAKKNITLHELSAKGSDSFLLQIDGKDYWFVKAALKAGRRLPYVGKLKHPDFRFLFTEIEPEEPDQLDDLCDREHIFIIGCDAFTHYAGIRKVARLKVPR